MAEERHYMNKMFGHKLDEARALDEKRHKRRAVGSVRRVTVEPDDAGKGHQVTIERITAVEAPHGGPTNSDEGIEKHSFGNPHEAMRFLHGLLGGNISDEAEAARESVRRPKRKDEPEAEFGQSRDSEEEPEEGEEEGEHEAANGFLARVLSSGLRR